MLTLNARLAVWLNHVAAAVLTIMRSAPIKGFAERFSVTVRTKCAT